MSIKEYLDKIRPYLSDRINDLKAQGEWKIELTLTIAFMSSKDSNDYKDDKDSNETNLHIKRNNIEIIIHNETDEITEELFESFLQDIGKD